MAYIKDPDIPMDPELVEGFMGALRIAEIKDDWAVVDFWLNSKAFARIERHADDALRQRVVDWRNKLATKTDARESIDEQS